MAVVVHDPYVNTRADRVRGVTIAKVGRTLVTTSTGMVFDTTATPPRSKGNGAAHSYLLTPEEYASEEFKYRALDIVRKKLGPGAHVELDELLYIAIAWKLEIPKHLIERAYEIHNEIAVSGLATAEPGDTGGEYERPLSSSRAKVRVKVRT